MSMFWSGTFLFAGLLVAAFLFNLAFRLLRADTVESEKSAARVNNSLMSSLFGRARTTDDWLPDARIKAGMVYNEKKDRFESSGRLSNEAFDRIFRDRT